MFPWQLAEIKVLKFLLCSFSDKVKIFSSNKSFYVFYFNFSKGILLRVFCIVLCFFYVYIIFISVLAILDKLVILVKLNENEKMLKAEIIFLLILFRYIYIYI